MTDYRFVAADLLTDVDKNDIPMSDVSFGPALNGGGYVSGKIPLTSSVTESDVTPGRTALYCYRDDQLVWGGIVWTLQPQNNEVMLQGAGFESYPHQRYMWRKFGPSVDADPLDLVRGVWSYVQAESNSSIGVTTGAETTGGKVKIGTAEEPYVVEWWDNRRCGDIIDNLADANDGFDYRIDTQQNTNGLRTKKLVLGYPRLGSRKPLSITSGSQVRATPNEYVDGTFRANHVLVMGAGEGAAVRLSHHTTAREGFPKLDAVVSWKDEANLDRLRARGASEINARQDVSSVPQIYIAASHPDLPLGSYQVGDEIFLDIEDGWTDYTGWVRIMGWTLRPDSDEVRLDLARADLFAYGPGPNLGS